MRGKQQAEPGTINACVVAGDREIAYARIAQGKDELFGNAAKPESADGQEHAVADDAFKGGFRVGEELIH